MKVEKGDEPRKGMPKGILREDGRYEPAVAYGGSKTANILMAMQMNKILGRRIKSFAVMPGSKFARFSFWAMGGWMESKIPKRLDLRIQTWHDTWQCSVSYLGGDNKSPRMKSGADCAFPQQS